MTLIEHVWGFNYDGGSNVVDVTSATYVRRSTRRSKRDQ